MSITKVERVYWNIYYDVRDWWYAFQYDLRSEGVFSIIDRVQQWLTCKLGLCDDCPHCETYYCWSCMKRVPWDFGCADCMPDVCDDCYAEAHEEGRYD